MKTAMKKLAAFGRFLSFYGLFLAEGLSGLFQDVFDEGFGGGLSSGGLWRGGLGRAFFGWIF
jgi:hypothetical protein